MENQYNCRASVLKSFDSAISPINLPIYSGGRSYSRTFDPYASDSSDSPSPLMKYLRAAEPAAAKLSPVFITPLKVEEDVLVMDGIPVPNSGKGSSKPLMRSSDSSAGGYIGGRSNSNSSSSPWGGSSGSGSDSSKCKFDICRFWEISGICRFGSKCQYAHDREELRPPRLSGKNRLEIGKPYLSSGGSSSSPYGTKFRSANQAKAASALSFSSTPIRMALSASPIEIKPTSGNSNFSSRTPSPAPPISDWSPQDDGIDVTLPAGEIEKEKPSKEDVECFIQKVLYGTVTNSRKRLPVFEEFCPY